MTHHLLKIMILVFTFCMAQQGVSAQEGVVIFAGRGSGAAPNSKSYAKFIRLIDADTKEPVKNYRFTYVTKGNIVNTHKTDEEGYGLLKFNINNYYKKVEINLNDGTYIKPEWKDRYEIMRNAVLYVPLKKTIKFPSKISKVDTVTVLIRKT